MSDWISVEERLPESYVKVLVVLRGLVECRHLTDPISGQQWWVSPTTSASEIELATHWMPLPAPHEAKP